MYLQIYKLAISTDNAPFYWLPHTELFVERDPYMQDRHDCCWWFVIAWLGGCIEFDWSKGYEGPLIKWW